MTTATHSDTISTSSMHSVPMITPEKPNFVTQLNAFLDKNVLPYPVKFLTNRVTILVTMAMLVPLIILANNQVFVLLVNSYLNVMSVVVSSTVLLYSTLSESRDREAAQRREIIAAQHQAMIDQRQDEDHQKIDAINKHIDEMNETIMNHVNESLDNIQRILIGTLQKIAEEDHKHIEETHTAVLSSTNAHAEELKDLREVVEALHRTLGTNKN